jgi:subtilase family serine protease
MLKTTFNTSLFGPAIIIAVVIGVLALGFALEPSAYAQSNRSLPMITQPVVDVNPVRLFGNTRPEANATNDRGPVADDFPMPHMLLQLQRSPTQEQALVQLIDQMHDPASPNYHRWLTPNQLGAQFGPASSDIQKVTGWLENHGFTVNVYPSGMTIDFSGTAGQVRAAFHTQIDKLQVNGVNHFANMSDPQIPAALAPVVVGVVSLHDFRPHPGAGRNPITTPTTRPGPRPQFTRAGNYYMTPPDLATIYNFNPVFSSGNTGQNQTIYLIEDTDLFGMPGTGPAAPPNDWSTFRTGFGIPLSSHPTASLTTVHPAPPSGPNNCTDPGVNGNDGEAILDAEYASAAAPGAAIVMATCADTATSGLLIAIQNLINGSNPPAVISLSYIFSETSNTAKAAYNSIYQQGVAEGVSIFVCAGDEGAAVTDYESPGSPITASHGINVNSFASTQYNVAVGGTDFSDTYSGTNSTYWNSINTSSNGSAKSYIPEIPWNTTCGSQLFAAFENITPTYGSNGFCNSTFVVTNNPFYLLDWAGSGGPSACATGTPTVAGVVSGTCAGYPKPSWQTGLVGNPSDGVRDVPDVSLFASFGPWNHSYVICYSDTTLVPPVTGQPRNGTGVPCDGTAGAWVYGYGGTSFASPIMAGVQALINQQNGGARQGNPNPRLYQLAATEYGASGSAACNSSLGNVVSSTCIFYDVTQGDSDVPCVADAGTYYNCYKPSGTYGVLSTSNGSYLPAYPAKTGWDFATGIGTVNVFNLVMNWSTLPFSALNIAQLFIYPNQPGFALNANFTLGGASGGINPTTELVTLELANFATSIPPGSFVLSGPSTYTYVGVINGVNLKLVIKLTSGKTFLLGVIATNVNVTAANPAAVPVTVIIDNDSGTATAAAVINNAVP